MTPARLFFNGTFFLIIWFNVFFNKERYAGDILRALELSGVAIPDQLRILWDRYKARQALEGKKVHTGGGFSGKGFKFDETEAIMISEKKKFQKAALGLQDSDDEDLEQVCLVKKHALVTCVNFLFSVLRILINKLKACWRPSERLGK